MLSRKAIERSHSLDALLHEQERAYRDCSLIKNCSSCYRACKDGKCDLALITERIGEISVGKEIRKKILPVYFREVFLGIKNFELRADEDNVLPGDTLVLCEWNGEKFTGREVTRTVKYVFRGTPYGLKAGHCIIGW